MQIELMNLRELINIFISDGFYKHPTNYMHSKLSFADLKDVCDFIFFKIKTSNFANFVHDSGDIQHLRKKKLHANSYIFLFLLI